MMIRPPHSTRLSKNEPRLSSAFNRLAWSNLTAQSAEQLGLAAAPIVAVFALGADASATALLQTAQTLPFLLIAIPAGYLADRISRRRLMASAEAVRALALSAVLALALLRVLTVPWLALLGFVGACGTVVYSVTAPALVPLLVSRETLAAANGRLELARTLAFVCGPALAGVLIGWIGGGQAFGVAAIFSICAVFLLGGLREPPAPPRTRGRPVRDLYEGAAFVFCHPLLGPILLTKTVFVAAFLMLQAAYVPYAAHHLGLSPSGVGVTLAAYGIGMVVGAVMAPRIARRCRFGVVVVIGPIAGAVAAAVMVLTIWAPWCWLAALSFFLIGAGPVIWIITTGTLRQMVTPQELLGRVSAIDIAAYGARPIGAAIGALVSRAYGTEACLVVAAVAFLVPVVVIVRSPVLTLAALVSTSACPADGGSRAA